MQDFPFEAPRDDGARRDGAGLDNVTAPAWVWEGVSVASVGPVWTPPSTIDGRSLVV